MFRKTVQFDESQNQTYKYESTINWCDVPVDMSFSMGVGDKKKTAQSRRRRRRRTKNQKANLAYDTTTPSAKKTMRCVKKKHQPNGEWDMKTERVDEMDVEAWSEKEVNMMNGWMAKLVVSNITL